MTVQSVVAFAKRTWRKVLFYEIFFVVLILVYILIVPPFYRAVATVVMDYRTPVYAGQNPAGEASDLAYIETQVFVIKADEVLGTVVDQLDLANDPEFAKLDRPLSAKIVDLLPEGLRSYFPKPEPMSAEDRAQRLRRAALSYLKKVSKVSRVGRSYASEIEVASRDPEKAAIIANKIASVYIDYQSHYRTQFTQRENVTTLARLIAPAYVPTEPGGLTNGVLLFLAVFAGACFAMFTQAIGDALDKSLRSPEQVERLTGLRALGALPKMATLPAILRWTRAGRARGSKKRARLGRALLSRPRVPIADPGSDFSQPLLLLHGFIVNGPQSEKCKSIGFCSLQGGEGSTTVAANFARLLARESHRVLFLQTGSDRIRGNNVRKIFADMAYWDSGRGVGCSDNVEVSSFVSTGTDARLLRETEWLKQQILRCPTEVDWVCVELPPLARPGDMHQLGTLVDIIVLVVEWGRTNPADLLEAIRMARLEDRAIGVLLNKVPFPKEK